MSTQPKHTAALRRTVAVVAIALTVALTVLPGAQTPASADTHALHPPSDITVTAIDSGAIFEWKPVPSATAYEIQQWDQQGNWRTLPTTRLRSRIPGPAPQSAVSSTDTSTTTACGASATNRHQHGPPLGWRSNYTTFHENPSFRLPTSKPPSPRPAPSPSPGRPDPKHSDTGSPHTTATL